MLFYLFAMLRICECGYIEPYLFLLQMLNSIVVAFSIGKSEHKINDDADYGNVDDELKMWAYICIYNKYDTFPFECINWAMKSKWIDGLPFMGVLYLLSKNALKLQQTMLKIPSTEGGKDEGHLLPYSIPRYDIIHFSSLPLLFGVFYC